MDKKVGILIPFYNREKYLKECLESIEKQSYKNWQVFLYDDGSTDGSLEIAREFRNCHPDTVIIRGKENKGVGYARNRLFAISGVVSRMEDKPDYLMWQDSDDVSHPKRLETMLSEIQKQDVDVLFSYLYFFMDGRKYYQTRALHKVDTKKYTHPDGIHRNMCFATALFKREIAEQYRFDDTLRTREDVKWIRTMISAGVKFGHVNEGLYYVRRHPKRTSRLEGAK